MIIIKIFFYIVKHESSFFMQENFFKKIIYFLIFFPFAFNLNGSENSLEEGIQNLTISSCVDTAESLKLVTLSAEQYEKWKSLMNAYELELKKDITTSQSIHILDAFFSTHKNYLFELSREYHFGTYLPKLDDIKSHAKTISDFILTDEKLDYLIKDFELINLELFSCFITLSIEFLKTGTNQQKDLALASLFQQVDNWETQGGCLEGRVNRIMMGYIGLMNELIVPHKPDHESLDK